MVSLSPQTDDAGALDHPFGPPTEADPLQMDMGLDRTLGTSVQDLQHTIHALRDTIARQDQAIARMQHLAQRDPLTDLPNRSVLIQNAKQAIAQATAGHRPLAEMVLDLDRFKNINDSLGHRVGDALLTALATRFRSSVRERDTVSRLSGDEFMLVLPNTDAAGAALVAQKLIARTLPAFKVTQQELSITPSIGIAMFPADAEDFDALAQCAEAAMCHAKRGGHGTYRFFTRDMQADTARALRIENALRRALEHGQLQLYYQPLIDLQSGRVIGAEALLRWHHTELGAIAPAEFIPVAEASGLVSAIGEWALRSAVRQLRTWMDAGLPALSMAVNLSAAQFHHAGLPALASEILDQAGLSPEHLELELTEGVAMEDPQRAMAVMADLHARGIRVSIDDFGTGYSSLSYLKRFRAHKLKIDQSFVRDISDDPDDKAIVGAIIHMASSLGLRTIAEGVETESQLAFLRQQGCDEAQGYLFSRPLAPALFEAFVRDLQDHP